MEGNNRLLRTFLGFSTALAALSGCVSEDHSAYGHASVDIVLEDACPATRADMPDEEKISDVSLMIFDRSGDLRRVYWPGGGGSLWQKGTETRPGYGKSSFSHRFYPDTDGCLCGIV